jgi:hypothetical protein
MNKSLFFTNLTMTTEGCLEKYLKKLTGGKEMEDVLKPEEARQADPRRSSDGCCTKSEGHAYC